MATITETAAAGSGRLRYLRSSPQKVRLVVDLVRGKPAELALNVLRFSRKGVAKDLYKLLYSTVSNAREKGADERALFVLRAWVDPGPTLKRIRANSMGRAFRVLHRTSHVTFELGVKDLAKKRAGAPGATKGATAAPRRKKSAAPTAAKA